MIALAFTSLALVLAGPVSSAVAYPATTCPTLSVSTTTPLPGETITVTGAKFAANATIRLELHSSVTVLATVTSSATGTFSVDVKLRAGVTGNHDLVAIGGDTDAPGCPANPIQVLTIQTLTSSGSNGGGSNGGGTAFTGVDVLGLLAAAGLLISAGVLFNRRGSAKRV